MSGAVRDQDWLDDAGAVITCTGKLRVLRENEEELRQVLLDACADALLMDVGAGALRQRMVRLLDEVLPEAGAGNCRPERPEQGGERL